MLTVDGTQIGQVNGLAVYDLGDFSFGKLGRITCTVSMTREGIFNIERASRLSGKIHDKGIFILGSFLNALLAKEEALGVAASVCFEQSYGMIDGDSATVAETVAVLSSLADIPVHQHVAMTGSLNQFGEVQPVGGINEKVEGFFKTSRLIGKGKCYDVLIPAQNVPNLMLHAEVRAAIDARKFRIFPIRSINDAFELATGVPLGYTQVQHDKFTEGTALATIVAKLAKLRKAKRARKHD
jgi:predicted ATP-dependent protease